MSISSVKTGAIGVSLLAGNAFFLPNSFDSIATVSLSGTASSAEFTSIPSTYSHLQIRYMDLSGVLAGDIRLQFNNDTGSTYSIHYLYGDGSSVVAGPATNSTYIAAGVSGNSTYSSVGAVDILEYGNTNIYKTVRTLSGVDVNGSGGYLWYSSGNWRSTSAVTSIKLFINGYNFNANSHFALYGIKA